MSKEARQWVESLALNTCKLAEYRVLHKLADRADSTGRNSWPSVENMATDLTASKRTVQRALRSLITLGLIEVGDQTATAHLPPGRRPTVYNLVTPAAEALRTHQQARRKG